MISPRGPAPRVGECFRADLADADALSSAVRSYRPDIMIHAGAITSIQAAFEDPARTQSVNVDATVTLAELAAELHARLVFTSTDLVFDGMAAPYAEDAPPSPLSVYARSKVEAEQATLSYERGVALRLALMYGLPAVERTTTFCSQLDALRKGRPLKLFADEYRTPVWLEDAAMAVRKAAESEFAGILHIAGPERLSRLDMGRIAARALGVKGANMESSRQANMPSPEPRPSDVGLLCHRYSKLFGQAPGRAMVDAMQRMATDA